jgi:hypothetical protein
MRLVSAFIRLREMAFCVNDPGRGLTEMEQRYDQQFHEVFEAIRELLTPAGASKPTNRISPLSHDSAGLTIGPLTSLHEPIT